MELSEPARPRLSRVHLVLVAGMIVVVALLGWTTWSARNLILTFVPQVDAITGARLAVTEAHLWLEEIVSGDAGEDPQQVWGRIADARLRLAALLTGGEVDGTALVAVDDRPLHAEIVIANDLLSGFDAIAHERIGGIDAGVGSDIDTRFDETFAGIVAATTRADTRLQTVIDDALQVFLVTQGIIIAGVIALFGAIFSLLRRKESMERDAHVASLQESFRRLEESRRELERQNRLSTAMVEMADVLQELDGERPVAQAALDFLCARSGAAAGVCWGYSPGSGLRRLAAYALPPERMALTALAEGEGLAGQVARDALPVIVEVPCDYLPVASGLGGAPAGHLRVLPLVHDRTTLGVVELAFLSPPDEQVAALMTGALPALAVRLYLAGRAADPGGGPDMPAPRNNA